MLMGVDSLGYEYSLRKWVADELRKEVGAGSLQVQSVELDVEVINKNRNKYIQIISDREFRLRKGKWISCHVIGQLTNFKTGESKEEDIHIRVSLDGIQFPNELHKGRYITDVPFSDVDTMLKAIRSILQELHDDMLSEDWFELFEDGYCRLVKGTQQFNKESVYVGAVSSELDDGCGKVSGVKLEDVLADYVKLCTERMNTKGNVTISWRKSRHFKHISVHALLSELGYTYYGEVECRLNSRRIPTVNLDIWYIHTKDSLKVLSAIGLDVYYLDTGKRHTIYSRFDRYLSLKKVVKAICNSKVMSHKERVYYEEAFYRCLSKYL